MCISTKISLYNSSDEIKAFLESHNIELTKPLYLELLEFLSKACTYEEEERKIRPSIILGSNLLNSELKRITQSTIIPFITEPIQSTHLIKHLKSSLPFCNNGWRVLISIENKKITYGIVRNFNGPSGLNIEEILSSLSKDESKEMQISFVLIDVISNFEILMTNCAESCIINFNLVCDNDNLKAEELFLNDLLSGYTADTSKEKIAYRKITNLFSQKLHGSICLIIKHDYKLPDEILKDGIFLETPIDICSILTENLSDKSIISDSSAIISAHEKFHSYTEIFLEMLNIDGITIVDNKGLIRAFNVFVKPDSQNNDIIYGGARKRAAMYLSKQQNPNYIGVYFQSQDGMSSYERIDINE